MNISFVIVNYMQEAYLDNMLLSISDAFSMKFNITIVIVDNSSSINSRMFFKTHENLLKRMEIKILKNNQFKTRKSTVSLGSLGKLSEIF